MTKRAAIVEVFYFDAGGGHRSAMSALKGILEECHPEWRVRPVDLQKLLEPVDPIHRITKRFSHPLQKLLEPIAPNLGLRPVQAQEVYNRAMTRGTTPGVGAILPMLLIFIAFYAPEIEEILRRHWQQSEYEKPDLVVSVIPNFNGAMFRALKEVDPKIPFVTIMTDMVDCPPHYWMEEQDQFIICGTRNAFEQAKATGFYAPEKIFEVSGMILKKSFYEQPIEARLSRQALGLLPDRPTALIMFGGNGSFASSREITEQLEVADIGVQMIVMCGNNEKLYETVHGRKGYCAVRFVSNVADYMRLADFFIGKPGPGCISEALHMGCPVIVECNADTMLQERPNVAWILEMKVGIAVKSFEKEIVGAVEHMLDDLQKYKKNIEANVPQNFAGFEIANLLDHVLNGERVRSS